MIELFQHQYIFLLLLAITVNLYANTLRNKILMYLLLIVLVLSLGIIFYERLNGDIYYSLLKILFSSIYFGPLLYFYVLSVYNIKIGKSFIGKHLILPVAVVVAIKILRLYFQTSTVYALPLVGLGSFITFYYLYKGLTFIRFQTIHTSLIAKPRFLFFYTIFNVYLILSNAIFFISLIEYIGVEVLVNFSSLISNFYYDNIMHPIFIILIIIFSLYALTEASWLKKVIVKETLTFNKKFKDEEIHKAFSAIEVDLISQKRFLESNLNINTYSKIIGVDAELIKEYVSNRKFKNFSDLLNFHRIEEFKSNVLKEENSNFTLNAIAFESGFNSKTTFFRVFKEYEKMTPKQFIANIRKK